MLLNILIHLPLFDEFPKLHSLLWWRKCDKNVRNPGFFGSGRALARRAFRNRSRRVGVPLGSPAYFSSALIGKNLWPFVPDYTVDFGREMCLHAPRLASERLFCIRCGRLKAFFTDSRPRCWPGAKFLAALAAVTATPG